MNRKIGVIVEGPTDKDFFEKHIKKQYPSIKGIKVISSATGRNQKIRNKIKLNSRIKDLKDKNGCNEIYILIDLDNKSCVVTEKKDFDSKMGLSSQSDVTTVVVSTELEAWMMSAWQKSDNATKEDLKKYFGLKSNTNIEEVLLQRFLASKQNIDCNNNESLRYFIEKLGLECK
ncbi:MAG: DUF4276 family protein [Sulfuricurvum sp.]|jgi:hypothetical protein|uniref:DUF3226 domain-containing protein n=1 Tax=Sulfuricurvum sp. TaxID=2025608 RepID=UPI0025E811DA|nr:DUF3226 domain-containing protein [Sulfuricurvum sp.]MCK9371801.1 DUF4276 family protein [Sulfuricurvum sp.]